MPLYIDPRQLDRGAELVDGLVGPGKVSPQLALERRPLGARWLYEPEIAKAHCQEGIDCGAGPDERVCRPKDRIQHRDDEAGDGEGKISQQDCAQGVTLWGVFAKPSCHCGAEESRA